MKIVVALAVALLATSPVAAYELSLAEDTGAMPPGESEKFTVEITMPCTEHAMYGGPLLAPTAQLYWDSEIAILGPTNVEIVGPECLTDPLGSLVHPVELTASPGRHLPGLVPIPVNFTMAIITAGPDATDTAPADFPMFLSVSQWEFLQVQVPIARVSAAKSAEFDLLLTNFGNAATLATFSVTDADSATVTVPEPIVVDWANSGNNVENARIIVEKGGAVSDVTITITTAALLDPSLVGETFIVNLQKETRSTPTAGAPIAGLVLLAVAFLARRRA